MILSSTVIRPIAMATVFLAASYDAEATFSAPGQGLQTVLSGTATNAGLHLETVSLWQNGTVPSKPYDLTTSFNVPSCDTVLTSRLYLTVWGGNAAYTANLQATVNGHALVAGGLNFGTTTDANSAFSSTQASVYGSGFGVWFLGIPVSPAFLQTDGSANLVKFTLNTGNSFDGRINQATLLSVYQDEALANQFEYAVAEGSGDLYRTPSSGQTDMRTVSFGDRSLEDVTTATLSTLYTYGDLNQQDALFFNGSKVSGDDVADYDKTAAGLDYGPDSYQIDVTGLLLASNEIRFSVAAADGLAGTRESSLRPQLAVLALTGVPEPSALLLLTLASGIMFGRRSRRNT